MRRIAHTARARSLSFPNQSRCYDSKRHAVRFWGHDGAMEASFFILADALCSLETGSPSDEPALLNAFDRNRDAIYAAAGKVYARGNKGNYDLVASDF